MEIKQYQIVLVNLDPIIGSEINPNPVFSGQSIFEILIARWE